MRSIAKGAVPHDLLNWKRENSATPDNLHYAGGGFPREAVREALLKEQHYLCAYTLKALPSPADCHIEHLLPQSAHPPAKSIDYYNLLACYPASNAKTYCEFGAIVKADYDPANAPFLSPLHPTAGEQFRFCEDGSVEGLSEAAQASVTVLKLNHAALCRDRQAAIRGRLFPQTHRSLSAAQARQLAQRVNQPDAGGRLPAFCEAIAQAALRHAEREERKAARLKKGR